MIRNSNEIDLETVLEPSGGEIMGVAEPTMYPSEFPIFLKRQLQGCTVDEVAQRLEIAPEHVQKLLEGQWRPSKAICKKMGLKAVYAITRTESGVQRSKSRSRMQS